MNPRVVLVTGEPGSGKTTLGTELGRALRVPFLARDDVRGGLFFTNGGWTDRPGAVPTLDDSVETFLRLVETMAGLGVSCVAEYVVRQARPEDLVRLTAAAEIVVVSLWCRGATERYSARATADRLVNRQPVLDALGHSTVEDHVRASTARMREVAAQMRTEFDLPVLRVNTDDGYAPGLDAIVGFATA